MAQDQPADTARVAAQPLDEEPDLPFPLHEDEEVYAFLRRHWLALYPKLLLYLIFAVVPPAILVAVAMELDVWDDVELILLGLIAVWIIFWLIRIFLTWYQYDNDIWVVTDQRLVDSKKKHPFDLAVSSADLVDVVDTNIARSGPLQTLFNFGEVRCQTAGSSTNFKLGDIPQPAQAQSLIDRLRDVARREVEG